MVFLLYDWPTCFGSPLFKLHTYFTEEFLILLELAEFWLFLLGSGCERCWIWATTTWGIRSWHVLPSYFRRSEGTEQNCLYKGILSSLPWILAARLVQVIFKDGLWLVFWVLRSCVLKNYSGLVWVGGRVSWAYCSWVAACANRSLGVGQVSFADRTHHWASVSYPHSQVTGWFWATGKISLVMILSKSTNLFFSLTPTYIHFDFNCRNW